MGQPFRDNLELRRELDELLVKNKLLEDELTSTRKKFTVVRKIQKVMAKQINLLKVERIILLVIAFASLGLMLLQGISDASWATMIP